MECMYGAESDNVCAYCRRHKKGMTVKQVRKKEWLKKNCRYLVKYETHTKKKKSETMKQKKKKKKNIYY